ncbi:MAG: 30S ribosomal protein S4 [Deferribacteres bacterium]|nr:30S ribosomal protein S4 [candidate division KSB1 bacterium]MCB9511358.1 30S ribosomal protein S4 [Deferribacteres bacterium]
MARYVGPVCKLCRREGQKLFLKGAKCVSPKCPFESRNFAPGQHGRTRMFKQSEYGLQLREKQKVRRIYGILEAQFHNYYKKAVKQKGITGENLLRLLESRLDNVVYRLGFAPSRKAARQLVRHRHFTVNGRPVDIPAYQMKAGDVVKVREKSRKLDLVHQSLRRVREEQQPNWLELNKATLTGTLVELPARQDIPLEVNESLIVELYSK